MKLSKATIIRSTEKKGMQTNYSEYIFHLSSYPVNGSIGLYEGRFREIAMSYNLHYHKKMTELFSVTKGEFYFMLDNKEYMLQEDDTVIIPPMTVHGFKPKIPNSRLQFIFTNTDDRESFFTNLAKIVNGETALSQDELEAFYNSHDQYSIKRENV
jgi:mannose-6-phosphate isomerase-like protein (cupin superfamily)